MTQDDEKRGKVTEREADLPQQPQDGRVKQPEPEEAPELLGERSDYPVPFADDRER